MMRWIPIVIGTAALAGCAAVATRSVIEQPRYEVIARDGVVEIRRYGPRLAAETTVPARSSASGEDRAFSLLAGYIFGGNVQKTSVAMTTPVSTSRSSVKVAMTTPVAVTRGDGDSYTMRFFLPAKLTLATAPTPNDSRVVLVQVAAETVAVLRFSGSRNDDRVDGEKTRLMKLLGQGKWTASGEPVAFFYDPPWTPPFLRRNEIVVPVRAQT